MIKFIFLDIDGVLNNLYTPSKLEQGHPDIIEVNNNGCYDVYDASLRDNLRWIIEATGAKVVGISSWFTGRRDKDVIGASLGIDIHDVSGYTGGGLWRVKGIEKYLEEHPCDKYVILDDQIEGYNTSKVAPYHLHTVPFGLINVFVERAIDILNEGEE